MNPTIQLPALIIDAVKWNADGLVPAIAQDFSSQEVLMLAYMNRESLLLTIESGHAHYFSRSRQSLWKKGESSGHVQRVREMRLDCDGDTILIKVDQTDGIACHTGRRRCFFMRLDDGAWVLTGDTDPVLASAGPFSKD